MPLAAPKSLPKWAWVVAIGGGLLIGYFLLRNTGSSSGQESSPSSGAGSDGGGGGGGAGMGSPQTPESAPTGSSTTADYLSTLSETSGYAAAVNSTNTLAVPSPSNPYANLPTPSLAFPGNPNYYGGVLYPANEPAYPLIAIQNAPVPQYATPSPQRYGGVASPS